MTATDPLKKKINRKGNDTIPEAVLLPYQQEWIADDSELKIIEKSRRIGLSWAESADDVLIAAATKAAGGDHVWYVGYNQDMARGFIGDCAFWARHYGHAASEMEEAVLAGEGEEGKDILTYRIKFASGHTITALSSRPANLRGKQGVVVIDEAAFHDKLDEMLKAAMALLIWKGKVRIISTHNGEVNPFNDLITEIREGKREGSIHRVEFKEAIAQGLYRRICLSTGEKWSAEGETAWIEKVYKFYGDAAAEELDVIPAQGSGTYLPRAMIEAIMKPDIPVVRLSRETEFTLKHEHIREADIADWCEEELAPLLDRLNPVLDTYLGEDFARLGDLTALWIAQEEQNLDLDTRFVVELSGMPYEQQKQILFYIIDRLPRFRAGAFDRTGNGGFLAEVAQQRYGSTRIEGVHITTEFYREHMPRMKARIEDRTVNAPKDAGVLADLRAIKKINGVPQVPNNARVRGPDGKFRHGDTAIALVMLCYAVNEMEPVQIEYTEVPKDSGRFRERAEEDDDDLVFQGKGGAW